MYSYGGVIPKTCEVCCFHGASDYGLQLEGSLENWRSVP